MKLIYRLTFAASIILALVLPRAHAIVPEPGNIYYGVVKDFFGKPFEPDSNAEVVLIRKEGDTEHVLARSRIVSVSSQEGEINYILRPSLDDGLAGRYSNSAGRVGDEVSIMIELNGVSHPIISETHCQAVSDPVPPLQSRGSIQRVDVRLIDDHDGDCISDTWENAMLGTTAFDGSEDFDEDGLSGLEEFLLGTHPLETNEVTSDMMAETLSSKVEGDFFIINWQREAGKSYTVEWSAVPNEDGYAPVPESEMVVEEGGPIYVKIVGMERKFFRVRQSP